MLKFKATNIVFNIIKEQTFNILLIIYCFYFIGCVTKGFSNSNMQRAYIFKNNYRKFSSSMAWHKYTYSVLDLEGTGGQDRDKEEIIDLAAVKIINSKVTSNIFHTYVNPERSIKRLPWLPNNIPERTLKLAPSFNIIKPKLKIFIDNTVLVGHHISVDARLLHLKNSEIKPLLVLDTLKLARKLLKKTKNNKLTDLIFTFNIDSKIELSENQKQNHTALYDSIATAHLFLELVQNIPFYNEITLSELNSICGVVPKGFKDVLQI